MWRRGRTSKVDDDGPAAAAQVPSLLTRPRRSGFQCVPLWTKIELESLIFLTQYNVGERLSVTRTGTPEQNRRIGRNILLLQMINPGAGREMAENFDLAAGRGRSGGERR